MDNNNVFLSGTIEDAELGETKEGTARCTFKIKVPIFGAEQSTLELSLFGLSAKAWYPHFTTGTPVTITGHLDQTVRKHEGKTFTNLYLGIEDIQLTPKTMGSLEELAGFDDDPTLAEAEALGLI
jgi:hypothetical protein